MQLRHVDFNRYFLQYIFNKKTVSFLVGIFDVFIVFKNYCKSAYSFNVGKGV